MKDEEGPAGQRGESQGGGGRKGVLSRKGRAQTNTGRVGLHS